MNEHEETITFKNQQGEKIVGIFHHAHNDNSWRNNMTIDNKMAVIVEDTEMVSDILMMAMENLNKFHPICLCRQYEDIQEHHLKGSIYILDHDNNFGMNGTEFLNKYKLPKEKVILTSGKDGWNDYVNNGYMFLPKPFRIEELYKIIHEMKI